MIRIALPHCIDYGGLHFWTILYLVIIFGACSRAGLFARRGESVAAKALD
jgi:hypothetical protein